MQGSQFFSLVFFTRFCELHPTVGKTSWDIQRQVHMYIAIASTFFGLFLRPSLTIIDKWAGLMQGTRWWLTISINQGMTILSYYLKDKLRYSKGIHIHNHSKESYQRRKIGVGEDDDLSTSAPIKPPAQFRFQIFCQDERKEEENSHSQ